MDGVCVGGRADAFQLLDDAVHPEGKAVVLLVGTGGHGSHGSHLENPGRVPSNVPGRDPYRRIGRVPRGGGGVQSGGLWKNPWAGEPAGSSGGALSPRNRI